ncbi:myelin expression factor 2-like [Achroia grisella]|uniref:myelin expression factor 2-like n=1 Tax=Achroia grisella TaxID=688607 RepID=UPI0027D2AA83|nr:myelin expression factor 2-like [Achroia grisella]
MALDDEQNNKIVDTEVPGNIGENDCEIVENTNDTVNIDLTEPNEAELASNNMESRKRRKSNGNISNADDMSEAGEPIYKRDKNADDTSWSQGNVIDLYGLKLEYLKQLNITPPLTEWVHVKNFRCDKSELKEVLEFAGHVIYCTVTHGNNKYARVRYSHPLEAVQAISLLNAQKFYGLHLNLTMIKCPHDTVILPKGLNNIGTGLGNYGKPLRDIVREYERFKNEQPSLINKSLFMFVESNGEQNGNDNKPKEESTDNNGAEAESEAFIKENAINNFVIKNVDELNNIETDYDSDTSEIKSISNKTKNASNSISESDEEQNDKSENKNKGPDKADDTKVQNFGNNPSNSMLQFMSKKTGDSNHYSQTQQNSSSAASHYPRFPQIGPTGSICRPAGNKSGGNWPMTGPIGAMGGQRSFISGPTGSINISNSHLSGPNGSLSGPMGGSSGPQHGPLVGSMSTNMRGLLSGSMGGPMGGSSGPLSGPMAGPSGLVGGPMGGPNGPVGGAMAGSRGGPMSGGMSGSMGGPMPGPMGPRPPMGPLGPVGGPIVPNGPIGGPMFGPNRPMSVSNWSMSGPGTQASSSSTIRLQNLPLSTTFALLSDKLAQCGQVLSLQLVSPGCAVVKFSLSKQADVCFQRFNRTCVEGHVIEAVYL